MEIQAEISTQRLKRYVGMRIPVLLEGSLQGQQEALIGRSQYQAPEVDGVVLIDPPERPLPLDAFPEVEILRSDVYDLYGTLI
jgi:ribosomal protein S12 methylthiotransferase